MSQNTSSASLMNTVGRTLRRVQNVTTRTESDGASRVPKVFRPSWRGRLALGPRLRRTRVGEGYGARGAQSSPMGQLGTTSMESSSGRIVGTHEITEMFTCHIMKQIEILKLP